MLATAERTPGLDFSAMATAVEREICAEAAQGSRQKSKAVMSPADCRISEGNRSDSCINLSLLLSGRHGRERVRGNAIAGGDSMGGGKLLLRSVRVSLIGEQMCQPGTDSESRSFFGLIARAEVLLQPRDG